MPVASYLPESMLITTGPDLCVVDETNAMMDFPTASAFGFLFHEYVHFLHNITAVSGIAVLINTIELWRCFRETIHGTGFSAGSDNADLMRRQHLERLLAYLTAARVSHHPVLRQILVPTALTVTSMDEVVDVRGLNQDILSILVCGAVITDQGGQVENVTIRVGTLELLESAAWLLEKRMVGAMDSQEILAPTPIFPYQAVEAVARHAAPGLNEDGILACVLAALQSSDAPRALRQVIAIANDAVQAGTDPVAALRQTTLEVLHRSWPDLQQQFVELERQFANDGLLARAVRSIVDAARRGFERRLLDPFFELAIIEDVRNRRVTLVEVIRQIPSCAILQKYPGDEHQIGRDLLVSVMPTQDQHGRDPEDGLRVVHSVFDYIGRHRTQTGLTSIVGARRRSCPFYTCCRLPLRDRAPEICQFTPWESADWPESDNAKMSCWYGTAVRVTRPPVG